VKTLVAAALLLALTSSVHAAPHGHWYLFLDTWTGHTRGCSDFREPPQEDQNNGETFATRKQCLARGRRLAENPSTHADLYDFTISVCKVSARCEWYRSPR
jgi:hypothetical protein